MLDMLKKTSKERKRSPTSKDGNKSAASTYDKRSRKVNSKYFSTSFENFDFYKKIQNDKLVYMYILILLKLSECFMVF